MATPDDSPVREEELAALADGTLDAIASDHDLMALLAANVGVAIMPLSARTTDTVRFLPVDDLELSRPVVLYAVAGRQRSAAATALLRLLREWLL